TDSDLIEARQAASTYLYNYVIWRLSRRRKAAEKIARGRLIGKKRGRSQAKSEEGKRFTKTTSCFRPPCLLRGILELNFKTMYGCCLRLSARAQVACKSNEDHTPHWRPTLKGKLNC
ncbi:hypothetical protein ATANTOWER_015364, partial [Ataeniobius toweri]|nr:hypothetical protein [Ataeniobius toweri]